MTGVLWVLVACEVPPLPDKQDPVGVLDVDVEELSFDPVALGEEAFEGFTLTNLGTAELTLELALEGSPAFDLDAADRPYFLDPDESIDFEVGYSPLGAEDSTDLVISSDDPDAPEVRVPVTGTGLVPDLRVDPEDHDFGAVGPACPGELELELENVGTGLLTISSVAHQGVGYTLEPVEVPVELEPGEVQPLWLSVSLNEPGDFAGKLFVVSDAPSGQVVAVQTARGLEPAESCP